MISRSLELRPAHEILTVEDFWIEGLLSGAVRAVAHSEQLHESDEAVLLPELDNYVRCIADSFTRARLVHFDVSFSHGQDGAPVRFGYRSQSGNVVPSALFAFVDKALYRHIVINCSQPWRTAEPVSYSFDFWSPQGVLELELVVKALGGQEDHLPVPDWAGEMESSASLVRRVF
jgi:hypothetical protein